ncbi:MAG: FecR domain-containing protein [Kiritimatiellae bacterium]|nr:FecR domain-containing protein [Kiritimatiellia bacterium]
MTDEQHTAEERAIWERYRAAAGGDFRADCPGWNAVAAYLEGRAEEAATSEIERHAARCPTCLEAMTELRAILADAPEQAPEGLARRVRDAVEIELAARQAALPLPREGRKPMRKPTTAPYPSRRTPAVPARGRGWWMTAVAASLLVALGFALNWQWSKIGPVGRQQWVAEVQSVQGQVRCLARGQERPLATGTRLAAGDNVRTADAVSSVVIRYPDQTQLTLVGDTAMAIQRTTEEPGATVAISRGKHVYLAAGTLRASAAAQPADAPMRFLTPHGEAIVRGTALDLAVTPASTHVRVLEGCVEVLNKTDGKSAMLQNGYSAVMGHTLVVSAKPTLGRPETGPATRVTAGTQVLYTFHEGAGTTVHDTAGVGRPLDLRIRDEQAVRWIPTGGLSLRAPTVLANIGRPAKLVEACQASNEITIEAWIRPAFVSQTGPARIVNFSRDMGAQNFMVGIGNLNRRSPQGQYMIRLRTTATSQIGLPGVDTGLGSVRTELQHLVFTRTRSGEARAFVDGRQVAQGTSEGEFSNWDRNFVFRLGNETNDAWPWLGDYFLVALYNRALAPQEVAQNFRAGLPQQGSLRKAAVR